MKNIYIGPVAGVITGQSVAFTTFINNSIHENFVIDINTEGKCILYKFVFNIKVILLTIFAIMCCNGVVYFTSSRSRVGFYRDFFTIIFSKVFFNRKLVNHLHGADFISFRGSLTNVERKILDSVYRLIDASVVLTPGMIVQYSSIYPDMQIIVIPNFFQMELLELKDQRRVFFDDNKLKVVFLSNLLKSKGIFELIGAMECFRKNADVQLVIAGKLMGDAVCSSYQMNEIISDAIKHNACIKYVGVLDVAQKSDLLADADVVILPSYYPTEAQPLCLIEGMAAGCLIVTTKHNYLPELVKHGVNGFLINPNSIDEIVVALQKCIDSPQELQKIKEFNSNYAILNYSQSSYVNALDELLAKINI